MIETLKFSLSPQKYYIVIMRLHYKKFWWLYSLMFLFALMFTFEETKDGFAYFIIGFGYLYLPLNAVYYYFWTTSSKNKLLFTERVLKFDENKLFAVTDAGSYSEIPLTHINKVVEQKDCLVLYIAKAQFIYIPKDAFKATTDLQTLKGRLKIK